jgi:hypothetical protein
MKTFIRACDVILLNITCNQYSVNLCVQVVSEASVTGLLVGEQVSYLACLLRTGHLLQSLQLELQF